MKRLSDSRKPWENTIFTILLPENPCDAVAPLALADVFQRLPSGELGDLSTRAPRGWSGEEVWGGSLGSWCDDRGGSRIPASKCS